MHIVIIGNGISGITAARFIRKLSAHRITVISSESRYFFSRTALMYVYMGHMRLEDLKPYEDWFWEKNRIDLVQDHVDQISFNDRLLLLRSGESLAYDKLIIACGSKPNRFGWPGQDLDGVGSLYAMQDLEKMEKYSAGLNRAVIVGGGLIGIEMAEMFHTRKIPVTMLVREKSYWDMVLPREESAMVNRHIRDHGIELRLGIELGEILGDDERKVHAVKTHTGEEIICGFVGLTAGVTPNIQWLEKTALDTDKGILVNAFLETSIPGVFAIGDCAQLRAPDPGRQPVEAVWYTGRMMGETVAHTICSKPVPYHPGTWFNSAKFIDIEYQVYGDVPANLPDDQASVHWEHKDGRKSIRLNFHLKDNAVLGFLLMGTRFRHEVCEKWIMERTPVDRVLRQLPMASFDPEFSQQYHQGLTAHYNQMTGESIQTGYGRSWNQAFGFLRDRNPAR